MTFNCTSMITLWRLDFTSPLYAGKYQTRTRRVLVQQEKHTRLQCNARYSVLVINYCYLRNYKCMKYKRCLLRCSGTIPVSTAWRDKEHFYSPLDDMLVHCRITPPPFPSFLSLVHHLFVLWGEGGGGYCGSMVSCPGTQHDKLLRVWKLPESLGWLKHSSFP